MSDALTAAPPPGPTKPLYPQLQPRWCGLDRDGVERNQRLRLIGAMIEVAGVRRHPVAKLRQWRQCRNDEAAGPARQKLDRGEGRASARQQQAQPGIDCLRRRGAAQEPQRP